jgi:hypothetical protein
MVAVYRSEDFIQAQTPGARDVDGYLIEIWYELPTTADPR